MVFRLFPCLPSPAPPIHIRRNRILHVPTPVRILRKVRARITLLIQIIRLNPMLSTSLSTRRQTTNQHNHQQSNHPHFSSILETPILTHVGELRITTAYQSASADVLPDDHLPATASTMRERFLWHTRSWLTRLTGHLAAQFHFCGVEMWRGGVGAPYLLPALSSAGASLASPCFRFHIPLIEPDGPMSGIRLSEKVSRGRPREIARPLAKTDEAQHFMQGCLRKPFGRRPYQLVLVSQPLKQPIAGVLIHRFIGRADLSSTE